MEDLPDNVYETKLQLHKTEERDNIMKRPVRNVKKKAKRPVFNNV